MSDSVKTNVDNNSVDSSGGTRTALNSPSLVRHKSSTSLKMPTEGRNRRAYTRTSTSAKLVVDAKPNQIQIHKSKVCLTKVSLGQQKKFKL